MAATPTPRAVGGRFAPARRTGRTVASHGISVRAAAFRRISPMVADVPLGSIVQYSLILLALIFAGWITVWQVRRRLTQPDESSGAGFTLSDLRQLHKTGQMSDEEFERAKAKVVEAARRASQREQAAAAAKAAATPGDALRGPRRPPDDGIS